MLANDKGMDIAAVHLQLLSQQEFQPGCIQYRTGADDTFRRKTGNTQGNAGEQIHRIGYNQQDGIRADPLDFRNNGPHDCRIACQQIQTAFTGLLSYTGSNNDKGCIRKIIIITVNYPAGLGKSNAMADIHCLTMGPFPVHINQNQLGKQAVCCQSISRRCPHTAAADDAAFLGICQNSHFLYKKINSIRFL